MALERVPRSRTPHSILASRVFALLIVICLVECASGNDPSTKRTVEVETLRGSCLSYGHSCWGAHGKRSGKQPATAPDWYLTRLLRRMAANTEMNNANQAPSRNDLSAIFQRLSGDDSPSTNQLVDNDDGPVELPFKSMEAKPMLDDDMISKIKLWQVMKDSSEDK